MSLPNPFSSHFYYIGILGSGMSSLAQFQKMGGGSASGSDRGMDDETNIENRTKLEKLGISLFQQDGSGIDKSVQAVIVSTAIEDDNPDIKKAKELNIPLFHRSDLLALFVSKYKTIAVAGTSGKSTVTAMIFEILVHANISPSLITGGAVIGLMEKGYIGNAFVGKSDILVIEADESDGTLVKYNPHIGLLLNIEKDHKELGELIEIFNTFVKNSKKLCLNEEISTIDLSSGKEIVKYGYNSSSNMHAKEINVKEKKSLFSIANTNFSLFVPGKYNVENSIAAISACKMVGIELSEMVEPLKLLSGVSRRFRIIGQTNNIEIIDDFAHNPAKIVASIETAQMRGKRLIAIFQLHGYGPARFLKDEFIETFKSTLRKNDILFMPEIFYAGGSAKKDISAKDITSPIGEAGFNTQYFENRDMILKKISKIAKKDDTILVMGARDSSLTDFCKAILSTLKKLIKNIVI